jgi:lipopolysaccharide export system permease protein
LAFAFVARAFLGRPRTNRQDRTFAIAACVLICIALRTSGFAAAALGRNTTAAIPFLYAIPIAGVGFGLAATALDARLPIPGVVERIWDQSVKAFRDRRPFFHAGAS